MGDFNEKLLSLLRAFACFRLRHHHPVYYNTYFEIVNVLWVRKMSKASLKKKKKNYSSGPLSFLISVSFLYDGPDLPSQRFSLHLQRILSFGFFCFFFLGILTVYWQTTTRVLGVAEDKKKDTNRPAAKFFGWDYKPRSPCARACKKITSTLKIQ